MKMALREVTKPFIRSSLNSNDVSSTLVCETVVPEKPRKPQERSSKTRKLLLEAAQEVFVRDGYEKAALADIAETAGKTRGAIYSHFKDKEEIFLTLVENHALRRGAILQQMLSELKPTEGVSSMLFQRFLESANDADEGVLFMEFQLYALRHPYLRERLGDMYHVHGMASSEREWGAITASNTVNRAVAVHIALAVLDSLLIGIKFASVRLSQRSVEAISTNLMKTIFEPLSQL